MFAASKSGSADAKDPQFNYVTMLLHGNGTNGAQNNTFTDSSTNNFTITRNGNTTQGTFSPYGSNWSNYFNATTDKLTLTGPNLSGLTNFTFECWAFFNGFQSDAKYFLAVSGGSYYQLVHDSSGGISLRAGPGYVKVVGESSNSGWTTGVWYHIALVKNGNDYTIYKNGSSIATNTYVLGLPSVAIGYIGGFDSTTGLNAYMSNARITNTAVYTSSFTPSTTPLTAISGTLLLTSQSNRFIDNSASPYTLTTSGSPSIQRFSPFKATSAYSTSVIGGSGYFDGSGDWITTPNVSAFDLSSSSTNFTIEAWVYNTGGGTYRGIIGARQNAQTQGWCLYIHPNNTFYMGSVIVGNSYADRQLNTTVIPPNSWAHIALVKTSSGYTGYVNGVGGTLLALTGGLEYQPTQPVIVGALGSQGEWPYLGFINDVRVVKGTAVYTANFTPPTAPLTAISNTQYLLNYTNAGILDNAMMNDLETVGNAQISTSVKKYGTGSMYFDGSGDNLSVLPSAGALGSGDWTVEFWWQWTSATGDYQTVVSKGIVGGTPANGSWSFGPYQQANNIWFAYYNSGFTDVSASATLNDGAWHHMAASRQGTSLRLFADGVLKVTGTLPSNLDFGPSTTDPFLVGYNSRNARYINGYVDDLRITKGVARYTANFTPPTAPFPDKG